MLRCGSCFCMSSLFHRVSDDSSWHVSFSLQVETLPPRLQAHVPISSIRFVFLKLGSSFISPRAFRLAKFSFSSWILFDNYRWVLKCFQARLFVIVFLTSLFVPQEKNVKKHKSKKQLDLPTVCHRLSRSPIHHWILTTSRNYIPDRCSLKNSIFTRLLEDVTETSSGKKTGLKVNKFSRGSNKKQTRRATKGSWHVPWRPMIRPPTIPPFGGRPRRRARCSGLESCGSN